MTSLPDALHGFNAAGARQRAGAANARSSRTLLSLAVALVGAGLVAGAAIALNGLLTDDRPAIALGLADLAVAAYLGAVIARLARD